MGLPPYRKAERRMALSQGEGTRCRTEGEEGTALGWLAEGVWREGGTALGTAGRGGRRRRRGGRTTFEEEQEQEHVAFPA